MYVAQPQDPERDELRACTSKQSKLGRDCALTLSSEYHRIGPKPRSCFLGQPVVDLHEPGHRGNQDDDNNLEAILTLKPTNLEAMLAVVCVLGRGNRRLQRSPVPLQVLYMLSSQALEHRCLARTSVEKP